MKWLHEIAGVPVLFQEHPVWGSFASNSWSVGMSSLRDGPFQVGDEPPAPVLASFWFTLGDSCSLEIGPLHLIVRPRLPWGQSGVEGAPALTQSKRTSMKPSA